MLSFLRCFFLSPLHRKAFAIYATALIVLTASLCFGVGSLLVLKKIPKDALPTNTFWLLLPYNIWVISVIARRFISMGVHAFFGYLLAIATQVGFVAAVATEILLLPVGVAVLMLWPMGKKWRQPSATAPCAD